MKEIKTNSIEDFNKFAKGFADIVKPGSVILLNGEMGAGKTTFVQAFAKALGLEKAVKSPTFIIQNEYESKTHKINHIDLYRLNSASELEELKIPDSINDKSYLFIEWANKFADELEEKLKNSEIYKVDIEVVGENERIIRVEKLDGDKSPTNFLEV